MTKKFVSFKGKDLFNKIYLIVLFFSFIDFYQVGIYFLIGISLIGLLLHWRNFSFSASFIFVAFFCGLYFIGCAANGEVFYGLKYLCLIIVWCYLFFAFTNHLIGFEVIVVAAIGMAFHGTLSFFYNLFTGVNINSGITYDVFTKQTASSTGQATNFTLLIPVFYWSVFYQNKRFLKVIVILLYILALIYDILIGGRTFILLSIVSLLLFVLFNLFFVRKSKESKRNITILFSVALTFVLLSFIINISQFFELFFKNSYLFTRLKYQNAFQILNDDRFIRIGKYIQLMPAYLYGGNHIRLNHSIGYAHNTWIDIYDDAGLFPFLFFLILTIRVLYLSFREIANSREGLGFRCTCLLFTTNLFLHLMIEPIERGAPLLICALIMFDAYLCGKKQPLTNNRKYENCNYFQLY